MNATQKKMMIWEDRIRLRLKEKQKVGISRTKRNSYLPILAMEENKKEFLRKIAYIRSNERRSISSYLKNFIENNAKQFHPTYIRTMLVAQKEQLRKYISRNSPEIRKINLSDLAHSPTELPKNSYVTTVKHNLRHFLNKTSVVWDMYKYANLNSVDRKKLVLLKNKSRKKTNYSLTKNFITKMEINTITKNDKSSDDKDINIELSRNKSILLLEYRFQAIAVRPVISNLRIVSNCQFCTFGHRAIFIPSTGNFFYSLDLYGSFSIK